MQRGAAYGVTRGARYARRAARYAGSKRLDPCARERFSYAARSPKINLERDGDLQFFAEYGQKTALGPASQTPSQLCVAFFEYKKNADLQKDWREKRQSA